MLDTRTQKSSVTIPLPGWLLAAIKVVDYGARSVKDAIDTASETVTEKVSENKPKFKIRAPKLNFPKYKFSGALIISFVKSHKKATVFAVIVLVAGLGFFQMARINMDRSSAQAEVAGNSTSVSQGQVNINRKFDVAIKSSDGKPTGEDLHVTITSVEKAESILIQNKPARTKNGKIFLLINMEIRNDTKKELNVKPVDMVRLVDSEGKTYAADVYNTDVTAEAVSIRKTRVGYVVDNSQKTFKLLIGEVREEQEPIEVNF